MVFEFQPIEKKFKKRCNNCGMMSPVIKGSFGHRLCDNCSRIKHLNKVNSVSIPAFLIKRYNLRNKVLFLADHEEGLLIRKAKEHEVRQYEGKDGKTDSKSNK